MIPFGLVGCQAVALDRAAVLIPLLILGHPIAAADTDGFSVGHGGQNLLRLAFLLRVGQLLGGFYSVPDGEFASGVDDLAGVVDSPQTIAGHVVADRDVVA